MKVFDSVTDEIRRDVKRPRSSHSRKNIFHLPNLVCAVGQGDLRQRRKRPLAQTVDKENFAAANDHRPFPEHGTHAARAMLTVLPDDPTFGIRTEVNDFAIAQSRHFQQHRFIGIKDRRARWQDNVHLSTQHIENLFRRLDIVFAVVAFQFNIGNDANLATVVGQSFAQNAIASIFHNRGFDRAICQQVVGGFPFGMVTAEDLPMVEEKAIAAGESRMPSGKREQMSDNARDHRFTVTAGNAHQRDASVILGRKEMRCNRRANGPGSADSGFDVHQQTWSRVDFNDRAALFSKRA